MKAQNLTVGEKIKTKHGDFIIESIDDRFIWVYLHADDADGSNPIPMLVPLSIEEIITES